MRKLKHILLFILSAGLFNSCLIDNTTNVDDYDAGSNIVTFEKITGNNLTCTATGAEYEFFLKVKVVGPSVLELKNNVSVTVAATSQSTAVEGDHYRIENKTITLSADNNYLGLIKVILMSAGNSAPMDGTPEFETYVAPKLYLELSATGDEKVVASGKISDYTLNFTPPNPYAGDYTSELKYFHPTAGGSYPDDPYGGIRIADKTLAPITGRKCETWFGVWDTDICWITVNADNSVGFSVWSEWPYEVKLGDPKDPTKVSHYDPDTKQIYLYYYYAGTGGDRIFWEVLTPKVK